MKSLKDLYLEISKNPELTKEFAKALEDGKEASIAFVHSHGCDASFEEMIQFLKAVKTAQESEITPEEMAFIAGGSKEGAKKFFNDVIDNLDKAEVIWDGIETIIDIVNDII